MKRVAFAFGRLNPPTRGHELLVSKISEQDAEPRLYLSHSNDPKKNPLDYETKLYWCVQSFNDKVNVKRSEARNMYEIMTELWHEGFTDVIYICGSDRVEEAERLKAYNGVPDKKGNIIYKFNSINIVKAGNDRINEDDIPVEQISASMQRKFVAENDLESFKLGCPEALDEDQRTELFYDVKKGMSLTEELVIEGSMMPTDITKESRPSQHYLEKVIDDLQGDGVELTNGDIVKADTEIIKQLKGLFQIPGYLERRNAFDEITRPLGFRWGDINKSVYSGKGGSKGQSAGQNAEPLVCHIFNTGGYSDVADKYSEEYIISSQKSAEVLLNRWPSNSFVAAHVDGNDIDNIGEVYKKIARMFKSKEDACAILGIPKQSLAGLYTGSKDNWCKADIVLIRKGISLKIFDGVNSVTTFNEVLRDQLKKNNIIPVSLKKIGNNSEARLEFVSNAEDLPEVEELVLEMPKKLLTDNSNNASIWLSSDYGKIQFRRQSDTEDQLSIEITLNKSARGGKGVSKITKELELDNNWYRTPITSEKELMTQLRSITPNISGELKGGTKEYPAYNRTCFRGLVNLNKYYKSKFGGTSEDMFKWIMSNCLTSAIDYYKVAD